MAPRPTARRIAIAARSVLETLGADAITMRGVARAVGITPMAIYRHFPDRDALLNALADEGFAELANALASRRFSGDLDARLLQMTDFFLDHALAHPRLFELMFLTQREGARRYPQDFRARRSPTANPMSDLIQQGMDQGRYRKSDPWEIVFEIGALMHGLIMLYLSGRIDLTQARFRALYRRAFKRYVHGLHV